MTDPSLEVMAKLVSSFYGWKWAQEDVADMGRAALKKELAFNRNAGLGPATDRLPDFSKRKRCRLAWALSGCQTVRSIRYWICK